jgi:hypothetical protein
LWRGVGAGSSSSESSDMMSVMGAVVTVDIEMTDNGRSGGDGDLSGEDVASAEAIGDATAEADVCDCAFSILVCQLSSFI